MQSTTNVTPHIRTGAKGLDILRELHPSSIKAAFFDIDGTLVKGDHSISQASKEAIKMLLQNGVYVGLASGRPLFAAQSILDELSLTGPHLFFSGALLIGKKPQSLHSSTPLPTSVVAELIEEQNCYVELYTADAFYIRQNHDYAEVHEQYLKKKPQCANFSDVIATQEILKAVIMGPDSEVLSSKLYSKLSQREDVVIGNARGAAHPTILFSNITSKKACRFEAFDRLLDDLMLSPDEIIAFGDGHSDLPFLTSAKYGIAMGNSSSEVKEAVPIVTKSVEDEGVAYALELLYSPENSQQ